MSEFSIRIDGPCEPFGSPDQTDLRVTTIQLDPFTRLALSNAGMTFCYAGYYVSNATQDRLERIRPFLSSNEEIRIDLKIIEDLSALKIMKPKISMSWKSNFYFTIFGASDRLEGRLVRILLAVNCKDQPPDLLELGRELTNNVRLLLGNGAAASVALEAIHDLSRDVVILGESAGTVFRETAGPGEDLSSYDRFFSPNEELSINLGRDVSKLLEVALSAKTSWERLLFLWIAIETKIGKGGDNRRRFFLEELKSEKANSEAMRLRNLRSDIAHEGVLSAHSDDCVSALWILRLCCIPDSMLRRRLLSEFEFWISSRHRADSR